MCIHFFFIVCSAAQCYRMDTTEKTTISPIRLLHLEKHILRAIMPKRRKRPVILRDIYLFQIQNGRANLNMETRRLCNI